MPLSSVGPTGPQHGLGAPQPSLAPFLLRAEEMWALQSPYPITVGAVPCPCHLPRSPWWKRGDPRGQEGAPGVTALSCGWQEGGNKHLHGGNFKITPAPVGKSHCCWCWEPAPAVAAAPLPCAHPVCPPSTCSAPSTGSLASHPCQSLSCPLSCWGSEGMPKHWDQPTLRAGFGHESGSEANRPAHPPLGQRESRRGGSCLFV